MEISRKKRSHVDYSRYRKSNFEVLRILSIYAIIIHHLIAHSGFTWSQFKVTSQKIWLMSILPIGKVGVGTFILITGYFTFRHPPKVKTLLRIVTTTGFYSILIYILANLTIPGTRVTPQTFFQSVFPIISNFYWFATAYFFMYILMPYLNQLAKNMAVKQYVILLAILIFVICGPAYLMYYGIPVYGYTDIAVMILLWFTGAFIRKFESFFQLKSWILFLILVLLICGNFLFHVWGFYIGVKHPKIYTYTLNIGMYNYSFFSYVLAVVVFLLFKNMKIRPNFFINFAASGVFAVYLIHDNPYVSNLIFRHLIHFTEVKDLGLMIQQTFTIPAVILIVCLLIEYSRLILFGQIQNLYIGLWAKILKWVDQIFVKLLAKMFHYNYHNKYHNFFKK